jgi:hypothetical protein
MKKKDHKRAGTNRKRSGIKRGEATDAALRAYEAWQLHERRTPVQLDLFVHLQEV